MHYDPNRLRKQAQSIIIARAPIPTVAKCNCGRLVRLAQAPGPNPEGRCSCGHVIYFDLKERRLKNLLLK